MPLLFSVRQHAALEAIHRRLFPTEKLPAFLDDTYVFMVSCADPSAWWKDPRLEWSRDEAGGMWRSAAEDRSIGSRKQSESVERIWNPNHRTKDHSLGHSVGPRRLREGAFGTHTWEASCSPKENPSCPRRPVGFASAPPLCIDESQLFAAYGQAGVHWRGRAGYDLQDRVISVYEPG